jgi:hypothetical protein
MAAVGTRGFRTWGTKLTGTGFYGTAHVLTLGLGILAASARADVPATGPTELVLSDATFKHQPAAEAAPAPTLEEKAASPDPSPGVQFGDAGSRWIKLGGGLASNFSEPNSSDTNLFAAYSYFLDKDIEFSAELGAWNYSQPGKDATGFNGSMILRWHFINNGKWTVYSDLGIGLLLATSPVPSEGTSFNFTPRAGVGFTRQLTEEGVRLDMGVRWAHVSNARISGAVDNPSRDSALLYVAIIFPF